MRLCVERLVPVRKGRPIEFDLPPVETASGVTKALGVIAKAMAAGDIMRANFDFQGIMVSRIGGSHSPAHARVLAHHILPLLPQDGTPVLNRVMRVMLSRQLEIHIEPNLYFAARDLLLKMASRKIAWPKRPDLPGRAQQLAALRCRTR